MTFESLIINGTLYGIIGKLMFKMKEKEPLRISNEEKKLITEKLERNKHDIFKSEKLNEIAKINHNLKKVELFEDILDKIEEIIPEQLRDTFYINLKNLSIQSVIKLNKDQKEIPAWYEPEKNQISFCVSYDKYLFENTPKEETIKLYKVVFAHELFHLASTIYDQNKNETYSGFAKIIVDNNNIINNAITEGFTQILAEEVQKLPKDIEIYTSEKKIVRQLLAIIDKNVVFEGYFKEKNINCIKNELYKIINDKVKTHSLIKILDNIKTANSTQENFETIELAQIILLDYYAEKIRLLSLENNYFEIDKLISILEENFITTGKVVYRNNKNKIDISSLNLEKFNSIINEYKSPQRKRQMN